MSVVCGSCGKPLPLADGRSCISCGGVPGAPEGRRQVAGRGPIRWEATIPLLTSRFYLLDLVTAVTIAVVVAHALVFLMGLVVDGRPAVLPWQMGVGGGLGLLLLMVLVTLAVFPGGVDAAFTVDDERVVAAAGTRLRRINGIVLFLALLSGRASVVGPALNARSREDTEVSYREIRAVWFHPRQHVIEIRDVFFRMTRLFCPPDRYEEIASRIRDRIAATPRPGPVLRMRQVLPGLGWTIVAAAAFVLGMAWAPDEMGGALLAAAVTSALAGWASGGLARMLGGLSLACAAGAALVALQLALASTDFGAGIVIHGYDRDEEYLALTGIGMGALALIGTVRAVGFRAP